MFVASDWFEVFVKYGWFLVFVTNYLLPVFAHVWLICTVCYMWLVCSVCLHVIEMKPISECVYISLKFTFCSCFDFLLIAAFVYMLFNCNVCLQWCDCLLENCSICLHVNDLPFCYMWLIFCVGFIWLTHKICIKQNGLIYKT